jgi:nucleoside-diphosphate-sugar epimerase
MQRRPNIDKAKELLKWEPKICLNEGLLKTINYFTKLF